MMVTVTDMSVVPRSIFVGESADSARPRLNIGYGGNCELEFSESCFTLPSLIDRADA